MQQETKRSNSFNYPSLSFKYSIHTYYLQFLGALSSYLQENGTVFSCETSENRVSGKIFCHEIKLKKIIFF